MMLGEEERGFAVVTEAWRIIAGLEEVNPTSNLHERMREVFVGDDDAVEPRLDLVQAYREVGQKILATQRKE